MQIEELLHQLNSEQKKAATHLDGPMLVLAGAGSGKTRSVVARIAYLLSQGVHHEEILGLTFTNKAAGEMKERVLHLASRSVWISTFHSLGARILRESIQRLGYPSSFTIYDDEDSKKLMKAVLAEKGMPDTQKEIKQALHFISEQKNGMQKPFEDTVYMGDRFARELPAIYSAYQQKLQQSSAVDFDDLLFLPVQLFDQFPDVLTDYQSRWRYLLVDEYQDTNPVQYELVKLLAGKNCNVFVVGDPDQSIYSWRGACIRNILQFDQDFPGAKVIRLEQNYRSTKRILEAANELISYNESRYEKKLWSNLGEGEKIRLYTAVDEKREAEFIADTIRKFQREGIPLSDMVVFYRTNAQSRSFEDIFLSRSLPYTIIGGISFYQRKEIKDVLAYLRFASTERDQVAFSRIINLPKRGIGPKAQATFIEWAEREQISLLHVLKGVLQGTYSIRLSSKQKKGIEEFIAAIEAIQKKAKEGSLEQVLRTAIDNTCLLDAYREDQETYEDRQQNLGELLGKAMEWDEIHEKSSLEEFLEEVHLNSSWGDGSNSQEAVKLMTLHNGKGLEFPVVFIAGLEEDLLPHANSRDSYEQIEEERRLFYVGITRAKERLFLSRTFGRYLWGGFRSQRESRFIREIRDYVEKAHSVSELFEDSFTPSPVSWKKENEEKESDFSPGDAVFHREFGIGIVQEAYEGSMGLTYRVLFAKESKPRSLVAEFAVMEKL
jgi:DNA helicase-2/ATP-dependent DNA helicase PcrA